MPFPRRIKLILDKFFMVTDLKDGLKEASSFLHKDLSIDSPSLSLIGFISSLNLSTRLIITHNITKITDINISLCLPTELKNWALKSTFNYIYIIFDIYLRNTCYYILSKLTWCTTCRRKSCCLCLKRTKPTTTSPGTTSKSRKNSERTRAISENEFCNRKALNKM